mgnify:CR=1 FL=1
MILNIHLFVISCLLIIASIIIWCAVMPGYKAVSRAVLIIFGCLLGIFVGMLRLRFGYLYNTFEIVDVFSFFNMIELVMAVYLFVVTWKYKVPAGIVGIFNVAIGIVSKYVLIAILNEDLYQALDIWIILQTIGLIITLIVIWVMLIRFLQTNSNGKHSSSVIVCPACGARLEEQLNFCPKCGYRFK